MRFTQTVRCAYWRFMAMQIITMRFRAYHEAPEGSKGTPQDIGRATRGKKRFYLRLKVLPGVAILASESF